MISINELVAIVSHIAGKTIRRTHDLTKPQGVRGRNSDNTMLREVLGWEPAVGLEDGLERTCHWIAAQLGVAEAKKAPLRATIPAAAAVASTIQA